MKKFSLARIIEIRPSEDYIFFLLSSSIILNSALFIASCPLMGVTHILELYGPIKLLKYLTYLLTVATSPVFVRPYYT